MGSPERDCAGARRPVKREKMHCEGIVRDVNAKFDEISDDGRLTLAWALDEWIGL
jgi:hypothetical protein